MLSAILSLLGSSAVSTALGGLFAWLNRKTDLALRQMDYDQALALRDRDYKQAELEAGARKDVAIIEGDATIEAARAAAIATVQAADTDASADELRAAGWWGWTLVLAGAARRFVRPALTVILVGAALVLEWQLLDFFLTDGWRLQPVDAKREMAMAAFAWVTGQASAAVGYWFVSRGSSR